MNVLLRNARKLGALVSVNHPAAPSGEICMGCGWTPASPVEMNLLDAFEVVNGGTEDPAFSGVPSWEHQLSLGHRLSAIGGSDNHRPFIPLDQPGAIGRPTTVVYRVGALDPGDPGWHPRRPRFHRPDRLTRSRSRSKRAYRGSDRRNGWHA